jgi:integrase
MVQATWGNCLKYTVENRPTWRNGSGAESAICYANYFTNFQGRNFPAEKITIPLMNNLGNLLEKEGRANATINRFTSSVKTVLNYCKRHGLIFFDVPQFEMRKENKYQRIYFTKEQVEQLATSAEDQWGRQDLADIVRFAAYTGMRQSEILRMTAARVDFLSNCIHVGARKDDTTKSGAYRAIPIHKSLLPMLQMRCQDLGARDRVFGTDWGAREGEREGKRAKDRLYKTFKKVMQSYPVNLSTEDGYCFHSLRHSFGTWHFAAGSKPRNIQYMMGHANIATTLGYAHATDEGNQSDINNI